MQLCHDHAQLASTLWQQQQHTLLLCTAAVSVSRTYDMHSAAANIYPDYNQEDDEILLLSSTFMVTCPSSLLVEL